MVMAQKGSCLRAGDRLSIDVDTNRPVEVHLEDFFMAGEYTGDKLEVFYLEEQDGADYPGAENP